MEPIETEDGSWTYAHPGHGATYRSLAGALSESKHVFVDPSGLGSRAPWRVLELGFGTGMNFATTMEAARRAGVDLVYTSLDCEPMESEKWLVESNWRRGPGRHRGDGVELNLVVARWQDYPLVPQSYDAYYHDPFGPAVSVDCWSRDCFAWAYQAVTPAARLLTYGASTAARRAMREAGFEVAVRPGAGRKREMTVAAKTPAVLEGLKIWKK